MNEFSSYLYTGEVQMSEANVDDLIASENYLLLLRLKNIACKFKERHMSTTNCVATFLYAEKYDCKELKTYAGELIKQNFATVGKSKEFVQISCHHIKDLISGDVLVIGTEEEVFEIVLEWIAQNQDEKEQHFAEFD